MKAAIGLLFILTVGLCPIEAEAHPDNGGASPDNEEVEGLLGRHDVPDDVIIRLPSHSFIRYQKPSNFKKSAKILFWSPFYDQLEKWFWFFGADKMKETCPELECEFFTDKNRLNESDVLLFMVYGGTLTMDRKNENFTRQFPPYRFPHQRWVYYTSEPPNIPSVNQSALNGLFNWTMTYRLDSDIVAHYGKLLLNSLPSVEEKSASWSRNYAENKTRLAAWFVSHCETCGQRELFVKKLQKYAQIDIYGKCGNYTCNQWHGRQCYDKLSREYKFYLSFENILSKDYVTEKFFDILASDVVPIVFGGADYTKFAPLGSYIDALDFKSPRALADYLHSLDENDDEYNKFFDWKRGYASPAVKRNPLWACDLCLKAMNPKMPTKVYHDMDEWWNGRADARRWTPLDEGE